MRNYYTIIIKRILPDIRFWIILFFIIRLYGITNPPLEVAHNWRQVTTNMYARNFLEIDANILYARVDMAGEKTGITGKEFPLYNYLIFLTAKIFGYTHWYGRLINLIMSSLGIFYFFLIIKKFFNKDVALTASILLICSIWFDYSRKIIPDTFSTSLVIIGIYYALEYLYNSSFWKLIMFFVFATLAVLSKVPVILLLSVLIIPFLHKSVALKRKVFIAISGVLLLLINGIWYNYWIPYIVETYGFEHYFYRSFSEGFREIMDNIPMLLKRFYFTSFMGFAGFILFIAGLTMAIVNKQRLLIYVLGINFIFLIVFIVKAGYTFCLHSYYIIPFVPVMALVAAYAVWLVPKSWLRILVICFVMIEGILNQQHSFKIKDSDLYKLELENIADKISDRKDLIVINGGTNPQQLYFTHRKGWSCENEVIFEKGILEEVRQKGAKFLFLDKNFLKESNKILKYTLVFENQNYLVYEL